MKYFFYCALLLMLSACDTKAGEYNLHNTLALIIILLIIASFFILALYSNILRDEVNDCEVFEKEVKKKHKGRFNLSNAERPYSLSKVQFAVWTVIISCSFTYLALCKGDCGDVPISQTALILMGIGAGVTTATALIDKRDIQQGVIRHQNKPSEGFFIDILSDKNGISLHRFQNVVWTVIAMTVYLTAVYGIKSGCALPELSQTLLILTGISSTTYVVLKANENTTLATVDATDANPPLQVNPPISTDPVITPSNNIEPPAPISSTDALGENTVESPMPPALT